MKNPDNDPSTDLFGVDEPKEEVSPLDDVLIVDEALGEGPVGPAEDPGEAARSDEFSVAFSDDELWDQEVETGDVIPLFDELSQRIEEVEGSADGEKDPPELFTPVSDPPIESPREMDDIDPPAGAFLDAGGEQVQPGRYPDVFIGENAGLAWGVAGGAFLAMAVGLYVLYSLATHVQPPEPVPVMASVETRAVEPAHGQDSVSGVSPSEAEVPGQEGEGAGLKTFETMGLAPFLIPAQQGGELVFVHLTVELLVPDKETRQGLSRKEAQVRDAIFRELKGIVISPSGGGDFLQPCRKPLLERLNRELEPLRIEDVKLAGSIMK